MPASQTYALFGAAPDTTNRGVSALFRCVVEGVGEGLPASDLLVFDNGLGIRPASTTLGTGARYDFRRIGARGGKRYHLRENLATMAAFSSLGSSLGGLHPYVQALDRCNAILDVSGGDSFSDIYGSHRFWNIIRPKLIAKRRGVPLVLLPQTYGPFRGRRARRLATEAVSAARTAWARDRYSFEALKTLLGNDFDESRHRLGVDMAFNLRRVAAPEKLGPDVASWLEQRSEHPVVGLNVSGLIGVSPARARQSFGLRADYPGVLVALVREILSRPEVRLLLIPHVMSPPGAQGSDVEACLEILKRLPPGSTSRIRVTSTDLAECEVKWLISQTDWFCGTRMHSTIAALSSAVPTAAIAYSDKTRGVFESCGVEDKVIDPRKLDTQTVITKLLECFEARAQTKALLASTIPSVKARAAAQMTSTIDLLKALS